MRASYQSLLYSPPSLVTLLLLFLGAEEQRKWIMYVFADSTPIPTIPLAPPDDKWLGILSTQGLAVLIALFALFVVFPLCVVGIYFFGKWIAKQADKIIDAFLQSSTSHIAALQQSVETQQNIQEALSGSIKMNDERHVENTGRLDRLHDGIDGLHEKIDDLPGKISDIWTRKPGDGTSGPKQGG